MIRAQRRRHLWWWLLLGPLILVGFAVGLSVRPSASATTARPGATPTQEASP